MVELAEILRLHGPQYRAQFGARLLPSHLRAMQDIEHCRTEVLGGQVYFCQQCQQQRYSYHSCKNRHCPKCQNEQANQWLQAQQSLLLPTHHFLVTFTLPAELRALARSHQKASLQPALSRFRPPPCCNWLKIQGSSAAALAWSAYCIPGPASCFIIRTFITSSPAAA